MATGQFEAAKDCKQALEGGWVGGQQSWSAATHSPTCPLLQGDWLSSYWAGFMSPSQHSRIRNTGVPLDLLKVGGLRARLLACFVLPFLVIFLPLVDRGQSLSLLPGAPNLTRCSRCRNTPPHNPLPHTGGRLRHHAPTR